MEAWIKDMEKNIWRCSILIPNKNPFIYYEYIF